MITYVRMDTNLTEEQKGLLLSLFKKNPDLNFLTQKVFDNKALDGRSREGRAVRSFLSKQGKEYNTTKCEAKKNIELTESQKQFLQSDQIDESMSPLEMAKIVFNDETVKSLSHEHRTVLQYLGKYRPLLLSENAVLVEGKWYSPKSLTSTIRKVNKWCDIHLDEDDAKITGRQKKFLEKLMGYLQSYKLVSTINSYTTQADQDLFESEFIRAAWDKPDLTVDEQNLYMMICSNHVQAKHIRVRLGVFNTKMESEDIDISDITIKITEHGKAISDELNACEKKIADLTTKLNGDRSKRVNDAKKNNANILALVNEFQDKSSRDLMVMKAEMQNQLVEDEATKFESASEQRARIFGISIEELV